MKRKSILVSLTLVLIGAILGSAFTSSSRRIEYLPQVFKKRVSIAPTTQAVPDTNALLQIGDADSSSLGHIRFPNWTDTSNMRLAGHSKKGVVIFSWRDTSLWIYTGARWKKVGS